MARYSLFKRPIGSPKGTKWERIDNSALPKEMAIRWWQGVLIHSMLSPNGFRYELRKVKD